MKIFSYNKDTKSFSNSTDKPFIVLGILHDNYGSGLELFEKDIIAKNKSDALANSHKGVYNKLTKLKAFEVSDQTGYIDPAYFRYKNDLMNKIQREMYKD